MMLGIFLNRDTGLSDFFRRSPIGAQMLIKKLFLGSILRQIYFNYNILYLLTLDNFRVIFRDDRV